MPRRTRSAANLVRVPERAEVLARMVEVADQARFSVQRWEVLDLRRRLARARLSPDQWAALGEARRRGGYQGIKELAERFTPARRGRPAGPR